MSCVDHQTVGNKGGYCNVRFQGKGTSLHRKVWCETHGQDLANIKGLVVMHTCDNPRCINPDHLVLGTQQQNCVDMVARGRHARCANETHGMVKLTDAQVIEIRAAYTGRRGQQSALARKYAVTPQQVHNIVRDKGRLPCHST
jgi:hypothetical protein